MPSFMVLFKHVHDDDASDVWLPEQIRQPDITFGQFKQLFKTFMFG